MQRVQFLPAVLLFLLATVALGIVFPLVVTGMAQVLFPAQADGSLLRRDGVVVGSSLVGQSATAPDLFHPRPSAAGDGHDGRASAASNLSPANPELIALVATRTEDYRQRHGLAPDAAVPPDAVTASASGLDPHISVANAMIQAARVARERDDSVADIRALVAAHTDGRSFGLLGEPGVNVVTLNLALVEG